MNGFEFSAADFRRRALNQAGGPVDQAWRDHGDHVLNLASVIEIESLKLKDAAVLVPIIDDGGEPRLILTKRTTRLRKHAGQIAFPGGGIDETDLSPEQAAIREAHEEIGLDPAYVETVGRLPQYLAGTGFRIVPVLAVVRSGFTITPNPAEVDSRSKCRCPS